MTRRPAVGLALLWLVLGVMVWLGVYSLYVEDGTHQYLWRHAQFELGQTDEPTMSGVMRIAHAQGVRYATIWAVVIAGAGWGTIALLSRNRQ